jgi:hypothetical protein
VRCGAVGYVTLSETARPDRQPSAPGSAASGASPRPWSFRPPAPDRSALDLQIVISDNADPPAAPRTRPMRLVTDPRHVEAAAGVGHPVAKQPAPCRGFPISPVFSMLILSPSGQKAASMWPRCGQDGAGPRPLACGPFAAGALPGCGQDVAKCGHGPIPALAIRGEGCFTRAARPARHSLET